MLPLLALQWPSPVDGLADGLARLVVDQADVDGTGKRKADGTKAATRLGAATSERWANERFRQVMLLVLEFRREWPNNSLLTDDDVRSIRVAVDNALFVATRDGHVGDIYDVNATTWAIWLVQRAHSLKAGGWVVESDEAKQRLTFEHLYRWLEGRHSLLHRHYLRDEGTGKVVHRYVLPFKKMKVPPDPQNMFKYRRAARRLSDWIATGSTEEGTQGLAAGIVDQAPPTLVAPPPGAAQREARRTAAWERVVAGSRARSRTLRSVAGETEDARETREMLEAIMQASWSVHHQQQSSSSPPEEDVPAGSDNELEALLERELAEQREQEATDARQPAGGQREVVDGRQGGDHSVQDGDLTREEIEDALDAFERDLDENDHSGDNSM